MFDYGKRLYTSKPGALTKSIQNPVLLACLMAMSACSSDSESPANSSTEGDSGDTTGESEDSNGDEKSQSNASSNSGSSSSSSTGQETTASSGDTTSSSDDDSAGSTDSESSSDSGDNDDAGSDSEASSESSGLLPNGEKCDAPEECQSGFCPTASSGDGVCSVCGMNQDCVDAGKGSICVEKASLGFFTCLDGKLGDSCVDESECKEDLACSEVPLAGLFCGECAKDEDCGDGKLCWVHEPQQPGDSLYNYCIDEKSLEIGRLCGIELHGDRACKDGFCELIVDAQGVSPPLGICSECRAEGDDCEAEEMCVAAHMDPAAMDVVPSECVAEDESTTGDDTTGTGTDTGTSDTGTGTDSDTGTTTGADETGTDTDVY